jgi:hypothetical protein
VGVIPTDTLYREDTEHVWQAVNKFVRYAGIRNTEVKFFEGSRWKAKCDGTLVFNLTGNGFPDEGLMILRSDAIKIHNHEPFHEHENCFKGIVREINSSEYGIEIMVDAGEIFYVDISMSDFKNLNFKEMSEAWITFPAEAGMRCRGQFEGRMKMKRKMKTEKRNTY